MEINNLPQIILTIVLVGLLLGVGVLVFDNFGTNVRDTFDGSETKAQAAGTLTVTNFPIKTLTFYGNSTKSNTTFNCAGCDVNYTAATGVFVIDNSTFDDGVTYTINYTYYKNSTATVAMTNAIVAVTPIASTWLGLIVTIIVLSIILVLVIKSFAMRR